MKHYRLYSETTGTGPVIVMLHGYLASSQYFKRIAKLLAKDHTVIRIDLLGHGRSPKPRTSHYSYEDHVDAVHYTLSQLNIGMPFVLVGHSMGALISLRYANLYSDHVSRLILFNPPMFSSPEQAYEDIASSGRHYRAFLFSRFSNSMWRALKIAPRSPRRVRPAVSLSDVLAVPHQAREGSLRNTVMKGDIFAESHEVVKPTMIVVGQKDRRIYIKNAMRHTWPDHVTLKVNPHGHNGIARRPELAEHYIRSHLL